MKRRQLETTPEICKRISSANLIDGNSETILAKYLWEKGTCYRKNYKKLPGSPDNAITKYMDKDLNNYLKDFFLHIVIKLGKFTRFALSFIRIIISFLPLTTINNSDKKVINLHFSASISRTKKTLKRSAFKALPGGPSGARTKCLGSKT